MTGDYLQSFFENTSSFSVVIGKHKTKNKRFVIFKPYITISNTDLNQIHRLSEMIGLTRTTPQAKKKIKESHNQSYILGIQNFEDVEKVVKCLEDYEFSNHIKGEKFKRFVDTYRYIEKIGQIHSVWSDDFEKIIDLKLSINQSRSNIEQKRYNKEKLLKDIKEHLES